MEIYDFIIIGSGAGGSVAFSELSKKNRVLLLEEGVYSSFESSIKNDFWILNNLYRDRGARIAFGRPNLVIGEGVAVGGSTEINGGVFWRLPSYIAQEWLDKGFSALDLKNLNSNYDYYSNRLNVSQVSNTPGFDIDSELIISGAKKLGWKYCNAPRLVDGCIKSNRCAFGCPTQKKMSMSKTLIKDGIKVGGSILTNKKVIQIFYQKHYIEVLTRNKNLELETFKARELFLACGAIETLALLKRSKLIDKKVYPISYHTNLKTFVEFGNEINAFRGTMYTSQINQFEKDGFLIMPSSYSLNLIGLNSGLLKNSIINDLILNYNKTALYTTQIRTGGFLNVINSKNTSNFGLRVTWSKNDLNLIKNSLKVSSKLFFACDAKRILLPVRNSNWIYSENEAYRLIDNINLQQLNASTVHLMGGLDILDKTSEVNKLGQLRLFETIHVSDSSILPTSTMESPQASIMSLCRLLIQKKLN